MIYELSYTALFFFIAFVGLVLGLSFYFGRKKSSASNYYAAGGQIHWSVNGVAFAGDYLSAASFLGICGMIATSGFDGFLYAIGFLAGWMVALFLVAEPFKKLGKYTFSDALNSTFQSRLVTLTASISTLIVSLFYLIPQMVGAGDLVTPLLGLPHWVGVVLVGLVVIVIVATAGMTSTTYVQFLKGGLLILLSAVLSFYILRNGLDLTPDHPGKPYHEFVELTPQIEEGKVKSVAGWQVIAQHTAGELTFVQLERENKRRWFHLSDKDGTNKLSETLSITQGTDGSLLYNGEARENGNFYQVGHLNKVVVDGQEVNSTGPVNPLEYLEIIKDSEIVRFLNVKFTDKNGEEVSLYYQNIVPGKNFMLPGLKYKIGKDASLWSKMDFVSLMLALFLGTAALPHNHKRACILYDPSHFLLQCMDYLAFIDHYHERIKMFHVKDAEFNPSGKQGVYGGYQNWVDRAGRFRSLGDGQVNFKAIFSKLSAYDFDGWAVMEWECAMKHPVDGATEGAVFIKDHIIRVTEKAFDDFASAGSDTELNKKLLGLS